MSLSYCVFESSNRLVTENAMTLSFSRITHSDQSMVGYTNRTNFLSGTNASHRTGSISYISERAGGYNTSNL